jgi:hypothetical protein
MAKRRQKRQERRPTATAEYRDEQGNVLVLRQSLTAGTVRQIRRQGGSEAASVDDVWRRRSELLFERLAVRWEIAGLPITGQKMLLGRYRMADPEEQRFVRETIHAHLERYIPELS